MESYNLDYLYELDGELGRKVEDYLDGRTDDEQAAELVEAIESYEEDDNEWWLSDDPNRYGYFQLREPLLLLPFDKFHEAVEQLLGHPVYTHELGFGKEELLDEAELVRERLGYYF